MHRHDDCPDHWCIKEVEYDTLSTQAQAWRRLPDELKALVNTPGGYLRLLADAGGQGKAGSYLQGRRALAQELGDRGLLSEARVSIEVLLLLPEAFLTFYEELFHRAYSGGRQESVMHGRSGGLDKAKGQRGMALGSDTQLQASGTGKKWKRPPDGIGSERAMRVKDAVDKGLLDLVREARDRLNTQVSRASGQTGPGADKGGQKQCPGASCGRFLKAGWRYCPQCGTPAQGAGTPTDATQPQPR